ncbi:MAG: O-antigen ligase family protein [Acidobacteriota bacterium]|nr:O-antigen ligase family protein [Acidobacteriota bacterium]
MRMKPHLSDYEPLVKPGSYEVSGAESEAESWSDLGRENSGGSSDEEKAVKWVRKYSRGTQRLEAPDKFILGQTPLTPAPQSGSTDFAVGTISNQAKANGNSLGQESTDDRWILKPGHALTYSALFLFTIILYVRPAELYPSRWTASIALLVGVLTLALFIPSQLSLESRLTARPREINLILLLCLTGLLSIPLAVNPGEAWTAFGDTFIRCIVIFIVMVNVVRTETRLKGLLLLAVLVSIWLSVGAINDYRLGLTTVEGYRVAGWGGGIFGNPNDMALHLVTIVPIVVALIFATRSIVLKCVYGVCAGLMVGAIVVSYSRGGFVGLLAAFGILVWKLGRRRRLAIGVLAIIVIGLFLVLAPGNYAMRLASIFIPSLDPVGSSSMRREILYRSLWTAMRHPLFGIGMGNFHNVSLQELVSHNAYTQVAAEMGVVALICYTMFIVTPFRRLGQIASETFRKQDKSRYYYLSIGLQASLLGYMVCSFFASVAYLWYVYYLVGYAVCLRRLYESEVGKPVVLEKRKPAESMRKEGEGFPAALESESAS